MGWVEMRMGGGRLRRRDPDVVHAKLFQLRNVLIKSDPMLLVGRHIPLEALKHRHVLGRGFLLLRHLE